ncbi:response regulator transcription factor [Agromyces fucosus]|uniref:Response regulator transcription factor n=1 Tax=Agromyces fucosus TaxID=41985 RepID=A0A4Q2JRD3_9MICO|nr:response regulator transcription factor [Agromyces fucosus]RXZ49349.1 response regulator transcription factor [Agromyces fucosus]
MRILLAEDQTMFRTALGTLLDLEPDFEVVAQVGRGDAVVAAARESRPDVALLDIEMPGATGLEVTPLLLAEVPGVVVVVLTTFGRPGYLKRALEAGARGFLLKDVPVERLAEQLRAVVGGSIVVDPQLAASALATPPSPLTDREREVLVEGARGATVQEIAVRLHLSPATVRNYLSSAIGKTGASNRVSAAKVAEQQGWL